MTRPAKKSLEKLFAEKAGELLNESWKVDFSPNKNTFPDLIVTTKLGQFELEVTEIYSDGLRSKGSKNKANEINNQKIINKLANDYYKSENPSICAKFSGDLNLTGVVIIYA